MPESLPGRVDVSVVVVARGSEPGLPRTLLDLLAALDAAARGPHAGSGGPAVPLRGDRLGGEIVLVAGDAASLGPVLRACGRRLRVVAAPGVGAARARNLGVAASRGRYLLFTLAEVRVPAGWVTAMTAPMRAGRADLVGGAVHARARVPAGPADRVLGLVPDPPPAGAWPAAAGGTTRAVLEAVGFDEGLAADEEGAAAVFRRDAVGAGFREAAVSGSPVLLGRDPRTGRRAAARRARALGRVDAYVVRHLGQGRPALLPALAALLRDAAVVLLLGARHAPPDRLLPARAACARSAELLRQRRASDREPPRSAEGDVPGGAGAPRAAAPVALVTRPRSSAVAVCAAPGAPGAAQDAAAVREPSAGARGPRGSVVDFWRRPPHSRPAAPVLPDRSAS
ncbi:glycosyltransferase family A protein [Cellulomonas sp. C5510]|uniref:glycosyltransferase family A protein n=1 Tax=Cellulomonas sp. C5510 TaxID=2871170 RepID=UPI001C9662BE|nr:glycosyltransferase family A protein [Cellulomonas sp. C5510]QZN86341.1 glycosyltransferase [Cellulomonas sp. C5510]